MGDRGNIFITENEETLAMEIKDTKPLVWHFYQGSMPCHVCRKSEATYQIKIGNENFTGTFSVCDACKNLDAQSIYDGIAG